MQTQTDRQTQTETNTDRQTQTDRHTHTDVMDKSNLKKPDMHWLVADISGLNNVKYKHITVLDGTKAGVDAEGHWDLKC